MTVVAEVLDAFMLLQCHVPVTTGGNLLQMSVTHVFMEAIEAEEPAEVQKIVGRFAWIPVQQHLKELQALSFYTIHQAIKNMPLAAGRY